MKWLQHNVITNTPVHSERERDRTSLRNHNRRLGFNRTAERIDEFRNYLRMRLRQKLGRQ